MFLPRDLSTIFILDDEFYKGNSRTISYSEFISVYHYDYNCVILAIGDPVIRETISKKVERFHAPNVYLENSLQKPSHIKTGKGNIFCPGSIMTTNIIMGDHNHFNLNSTVGHDCTLGSFNTVSPGVNVSGNCTIGNRVYLGTNCALKEWVSICDDVTVGMGSVVINSITEPGTYVGVPSKKLK